MLVLQLGTGLRVGSAWLAGDLAVGKKAFEETCLVCHTLNGTGGKIGPELTGVGIRPKADILMQILDPNRNVEGTFRMWTKSRSAMSTKSR